MPYSAVSLFTDLPFFPQQTSAKHADKTMASVKKSNDFIFIKTPVCEIDFGIYSCRVFADKRIEKIRLSAYLLICLCRTIYDTFTTWILTFCSESVIFFKVKE